MNNAILEENGVDCAAGVARLLGDGALYEQLLRAFLSDDSFSKARRAFDAGDNRALFAQAHALKGVSGNLDMPELYRASGALAEFLRQNREPQAAAVAALFDPMQAAYRRVVGGIRAAL